MKAKKSTTPTDPKSSLVNGLSKANDSLIQASGMIGAAANYLTSSNTTFTTGTGGGTLIGYGGSNCVSTYTAPSISTNIIYPADYTNLYPKVDIETLKGEYWETENIGDYRHKYNIKVYLAGVDKKRVHLHLEEGAFVGTVFYLPKMTITVDKSVKDENDDEKEWFIKESKQSFTARVVNLPDDADTLTATPAIMKNGILEFEVLARTEPHTPTQITRVEIK